MTSSTHSRLRDGGDYLRLKAAFRQLCTRLGGYEAASKVTRGAVTSLHRHGDPQCDTLYPAIDMVLDLESAAGAPLVSALLAELQGWRLAAATPGCVVSAAATTQAQALAVMREAGEYAGAAADMDADGKHTVNELRRVIREAEEAKAALESALVGLYRELAEKMEGRHG